MDLPSDSDESDVDFVPEGEESHSDGQSEEEADKETDTAFEEEQAKKKLKRSAKSSSQKRQRKKAKIQEEEKEEPEVLEKKLNPAEEKKYEDDLWASFLGTPTQTKAEEKKTPVSKESAVSSVSEIIDKVEVSKDIVVSDSPSGKPVAAPSNTLGGIKGKLPVVSKLPGARKPGGGMASVLNMIGKKDKVSILEKSKLDWKSFKTDEGIGEEIQTFNRGKDGYLERQDFLQRTDLRQFEIEKNLRTTKRSNR